MNITYICPADDRPVGGIKVLYRHAEMLAAHGVDADIFHPNKPDFRCSWFSHNARLRKATVFERKNDFIVIPEEWAFAFGKQCLEQRIKYAIFVQNGYLIKQGMGRGNKADLRGIYEKASLIASISEDTTEMIFLAFPQVAKDKVVRLLPSVSNKFHAGPKKKIISYMPRKLPVHAEKVCFYLAYNLPDDWNLFPIKDMNEDQVVNALSESSIFMSFCDQEGCPLPPLEAAFSGNLVVGYTGQGAKEYFSKPIFREIQNGDFRYFVAGVRQAITDIESGIQTSEMFLRQAVELKDDYSNDNELSYLLGFASRVENILAQEYRP